MTVGLARRAGKAPSLCGADLESANRGCGLYRSPDSAKAMIEPERLSPGAGAYGYPAASLTLRR